MRSTDRTLSLELHNHTLNKTFAVNSKQPYRLLSIAGLGSTGYDVAAMSHAVQDGAFVANTRLRERYIPMKLECSDYENSVELRNELIHFMSPVHRYTLYIERSGIKRRIDCRVNDFAFDTPNIYEFYAADFELICPSPFFLDEADTTQQFLTFAPQMSFPLAFPRLTGMTTAVPIVLDGMTVSNDGDVPTGFIADIEVHGGDMVNPQISLGDEYVRVNITLHAGDKLQIDTRQGNKNIYVNGVSSFRFDRTSVFFQLPPGVNTLKVSADEGVGNARTTIIYSNRWLGV